MLKILGTIVTVGKIGINNSTMEHLSNNCCEGGNLRMKNRSKGSYIGMYRFMTVFL